MTFDVSRHGPDGDQAGAAIRDELAGAVRGQRPQLHCHALATAETAIKNLADTINVGGKNGVVIVADQSSVIQASASGQTLTFAFRSWRE